MPNSTKAFLKDSIKKLSLFHLKDGKPYYIKLLPFFVFLKIFSFLNNFFKNIFTSKSLLFDCFFNCL